MNDLSTWVTAIASTVSAWAACAMWKVSRNTLNLQASVESAKEPKVYAWFKDSKFLTLTNLGKETLPIRELKVLKDPSEKGHLEIFFALAKLNLHGDTHIEENYYAVMGTKMIEPNTPVLLVLKEEFPVVNLQARYFDGTTETIEIKSGSKSILKGKGK